MASSNTSKAGVLHCGDNILHAALNCCNFALCHPAFPLYSVFFPWYSMRWKVFQTSVPLHQLQQLLGCQDAAPLSWCRTRQIARVSSSAHVQDEQPVGIGPIIPPHSGKGPPQHLLRILHVAADRDHGVKPVHPTLGRSIHWHTADHLHQAQAEGMLSAKNEFGHTVSSILGKKSCGASWGHPLW